MIFHYWIKDRALVKPFEMIVKAAPADSHHLAEHGGRVGLHLLPDKGEPHLGSLAKKAAALFQDATLHLQALVFLLQPLEFGSIRSRRDYQRIQLHCVSVIREPTG